MSTKTLNIEILDWEDFQLGYLKNNPVPVDEETGEPTMTVEEWIKTKMKNEIFALYKAGKNKIAEELAVPVINQGIIGA